MTTATMPVIARQMVGNSLDLESCNSAIVALAGANYTNPGGLPVLVNEINRVSTVANAGDAVVLPSAIPGLEIIVFHSGAQELAVFAGGADQINSTGAGGYVTQMPQSFLLFVCSSQGLWECETVGQGFLGNLPTSSGKDAIVAAGATQGTATALTHTVNRITTVVAGAGVVLPSIAGLPAASSLMITVINAQGVNALLVYPAGVDKIEALGAGGAYSLAAAASGQLGKVATFISTVAGQWHLMLSSN